VAKGQRGKGAKWLSGKVVKWLSSIGCKGASLYGL
jgi:hypothetical protein